MHYNAFNFFYKRHVTEIKLAISYQYEYDIQIAKLALVF